MATKIRLQRHGKKGKPFYHVVVADSRAPRDGKFIERIGSYNPNTNPATIDLNFDKALDWLNQGAQPTDTTRAILSYKGVLYKKHLQGGVKKGAFDQETADARFAEWLKSKEALIDGKKEGLAQSKAEAKKAALAAEAKKKAEIAAAVEAKNTPPAEETEEVAAEEAPEAAAPETAEASATEAEATAPEDTTEAAETEATTAEAAEEAPAAADAKATEETPAAEAPEEEKKTEE